MRPMKSKFQRMLEDEDEFLAELLRVRPELRVEVLPNGKKIIHGIALSAWHHLEERRKLDGPNAYELADPRRWREL